MLYLPGSGGIVESGILRPEPGFGPPGRLNDRILNASLMDKSVHSSSEKNGLVKSATNYLMSRTGSGLFPRDIQFKNAFLNSDIYTRGNKLALFTLYNLEKAQHKEIVEYNQLSEI